MKRQEMPARAAVEPRSSNKSIVTHLNVIRTRPREHKAMLAWFHGFYDPHDSGEAEIVAALGRLARRCRLGRVAYLRSVYKR